MVKKGVFTALTALAVLMVLSGCEQFFTTSPIAFLGRPATAMTEGQQIEFGQDALASGDEAKMKDAYTALATNTDSAEAQYVAAQLAIEISGVPEYLREVLITGGQLSIITDDPAAFDAYIEEQGLEPGYLAAAAENLLSAQALGVTLEPMDYMMGALGLVVEAATQSGGELDFNNLDADIMDKAEAFVAQQSLTDTINALPDTDPLKAILGTLGGYITGLP